MADPIGSYNSDYTGGEIDEAVKQIKNKTDAPTGSTIMQRDVNGRAQVEDGTSGKEIVNFDQLQAAIKSTTNNINHLNGIVAQQNTALNELQTAIKSTYRHVIQLSKEDNQHLINAVLVVYSSNSTEVNSLETLKALLGNTFIYPVNGTVNYAGDGRYATTYMKQDYLYTMKDFISLTGITFTDTFTEI